MANMGFVQVLAVEVAVLVVLYNSGKDRLFVLQDNCK